MAGAEKRAPAAAPNYTGLSKERDMANFSLGSIGQIARTVADIEAAKAWYGQVLGLPLLYSFPGMAFFDLGGTRLYLQQAEGAATESILYFQVADIEAAHRALVARGATFTGAPQCIHRHADGTEEWLAFFADPEGRTLALISQRRP
jgi:predicted enzyme related to lactoylglutathione lyase